MHRENRHALQAIAVSPARGGKDLRIDATSPWLFHAMPEKNLKFLSKCPYFNGNADVGEVFERFCQELLQATDIKTPSDDATGYDFGEGTNVYRADIAAIRCAPGDGEGRVAVP